MITPVVETELVFDPGHEEGILFRLDECYREASWSRHSAVGPRHWPNNPQTPKIFAKWRYGTSTVYRVGYEALSFVQLISTHTSTEDASLDSCML
jgi:hypothetical protein